MTRPTVAASAGFHPDRKGGLLSCALSMAALLLPLLLPRTARAQSSWTAPVNLSQTLQPASGQDTFLDANNTLHVFFLAIQGTGARQLWHTAFRVGQGGHPGGRTGKVIGNRRVVPSVPTFPGCCITPVAMPAHQKGRQ